MPNIENINPRVHYLEQSMCFKTWNDIIISLPRKNVKWCCKTVMNKNDEDATTFTLDTLTEDFLFNHPVLQRRKWELSGGTRSEDCTFCWKSEDAGGRSVRTEYTKNYDFHMKRDLRKSLQHPKKRIAYHQKMRRFDNMKFIEIELTNKCNMACVYCWGGSSTRWQKELGQRFPDTEDLIFDKVIKILNSYWDHSLKDREHVNFSLLGGEPFFTEHMYKFIEEFMVNINDKMDPKSEQRVVITVTTNMNFPRHKFDRFIELVKRTPNITYDMQISGEAIGKRSEIIRWGLIWDTWDKNLDLFFEKGKELPNLLVGFGCAHNSLSLPYFKDFLIYLDDKLKLHNYKNKIHMHSNWVDNPAHLSVSALEPHHAKAIDEQIDFLNSMEVDMYQKEKYMSLMETMKSIVESPVDPNIKGEAWIQFKKLEDRRKISFAEHFPHYHELIEDGKNIVSKWDKI